ncbi:sce7726 family protein, partial [Nostoc sp. CHAB 5836]|nr:sce7726 family protein [Nostoc sp. CHAB 5836]
GTTGRRADLAIHNGSKFFGIEVKSQYDNLTRLHDQLKIYTRCFDEVIIVLDERHVREGLEIASEDVTVFEIDNKGNINLRRPASLKPHIYPETRLQLLTTQELKKLTGHLTRAPAKRTLLLKQAEILPKDSIINAVAESFRQNFSDTSEIFWRHVKHKKMTPDSLGFLSRFTPERIKIREKHDAQIRFWDTWQLDAVTALQIPAN